MKIVVVDDYEHALRNIGKALQMLGHSSLCIQTREMIDIPTQEVDLNAIEKAIVEFQPDLYFLDDGCLPRGGAIAHKLSIPKERVVSISSSSSPVSYAFARLSMKEQMNISKFEPGIATHMLGFFFDQEKHLVELGLRPLDVPLSPIKKVKIGQ